MTVIQWLIVIVSVAFIAWYKSSSKPSRLLPPGPPADPLIGHLRILPSKDQSSVFHSWAQSYGDVVYVQVPWRSFVILDSVRAATDLLDKRSSIYSDRPSFTVLEMLGYLSNLSLMAYGPRFRVHRKILHSYLIRKACLPWRAFQTQSARKLTKSLLENSSDFEKHFSWFAAAIATKVAYGLDISQYDEYVQLAELSGFALNNSGTPGGTPVDIFPFLRHFPSWFPGTFYAQFARKWAWAIRRLYDLPFGIVEQNMAEGTAEPSLLTTELTKLSQKESVTKEDLETAKGVSAHIYIAGSETTWSALSVFLLSMMMFPEAQKRAQEELHRVIGQGRLPEFSDYDSLPYIECLLQEVLRWFPTVPLGMPHRCMQDDIYRDMLIPKGSVVIANIRAMSLDEATYANPTAFNPSRFLPKPEGGGEPFFSHVFGFGRRICPGRHLAVASLWIAIATILTTSRISKATDEHGKEIDLNPEYSHGLVSRPEQFQCKIQSRFPHSMNLLREELPQ